MIIHSPIISGSLTFANGATFTLPTGGVYSGSFSGSFQGPTFSGGTFSGVINSTNGVVSGSSQVSYVGLSNIPAGIVSSSAQIDTLFNLDNVVSSSAQVTPLLPSGTVSGSSQITLSSTTGYGTVINQNLLTTSDVTHNSITGQIRATNGVVSGSSQVVGSSITTNTITIGSTSTALGGTSTTLAGLTSVNSTQFTGSLSGNASTATTLQTARNINGTSFNGSADITIPNLVSGSSQITLSSTTGYGTVINQNLLTTSDVTHNSITGTIRATNGVVSGSSQISGTGITNNTITIAGTSTALGGSITAPTILQGTGVVSGSSQVTLASTTGFGTYIDQALLTTSNVTHNNVTVSGNLTVNGTTTTVNSTTLAIADNVIELNYGGSAVRAGILAKDATGTLTSGSFLWDGTNDYWVAGASGSELPIATTTGTQTLTNKTIAAGSNTISGLTNSNLSGTAGITNANLANSTITIAGTSTALGGSITAATILQGTGVVSGSSQIVGSSITTNTVTVGSTSIALGGTATTLAGLSSVTSTGFTGALTGNASTATTLQTARNINGTSFNGSADIVIPNLVSGSAQITKTLQDVTTAGATTSTAVSFTNATASTTTGTGAVIITGGVGIGGALNVGGDITAYATSDKNFKENIVPIPNAINKIKQISGNTYDWKSELKDIHGFEGNDVGVIAQEIEEVLPQLVQTRDNGYKAVKYDKLVALLIEGIKEQQTQIEELRNKIEKLENGK
jgi:hypothetical protein